LAALAAGIWLLSAHGQSRPQGLRLDAPAAQFSAARADAVLGRILDQQRPHPAGSVENQAVRTRILKELAALGVPARVQSRMSCYGEGRWGAISCGTVNNIIASVAPGEGKEIVLMAHGDSVAAGPGAGDDTSGVATILETIRALKARGLPQGHPIVALFSDGEENGLLGAAAYLRDPQTRERTGAVINMESRGNQGPSFLFQTGAGDARLIDLYANAVPRYAASSLYAEIYKYLPNDTDMTPFLAAGITGYNFAFIGNAAQYHTPLDRRENIDPRTLQQHGDNLLGLTDALSRADLATLKSGKCDLSGCAGTLAAAPAAKLVAAFVHRRLCADRFGRMAARAADHQAVAGSRTDAAFVAVGMYRHRVSASRSGGLDIRISRSVFRLSVSDAPVFGLRCLCRGAAGGGPCRRHCLLAVAGGSFHRLRHLGARIGAILPVSRAGSGAVIADAGGQSDVVHCGLG
jgi:hypothetical protein